MKAAFFAQYWEQKIVVMPYKKGLATPFEALYYWNHKEVSNESYLELFDLSQISDEDARECGFNEKNDIDNPNYGISPSGLFLNWLDDWEIEAAFSMTIIDYLRSRGYALPYRNISVEQQIKNGWVKIAEQ